MNHSDMIACALADELKIYFRVALCIYANAPQRVSFTKHSAMSVVDTYNDDGYTRVFEDEERDSEPEPLARNPPAVALPRNVGRTTAGEVFGREGYPKAYLFPDVPSLPLTDAQLERVCEEYRSGRPEYTVFQQNSPADEFTGLVSDLTKHVDLCLRRTLVFTVEGDAESYYFIKGYFKMSDALHRQICASLELIDDVTSRYESGDFFANVILNNSRLVNPFSQVVGYQMVLSRGNTKGGQWVDKKVLKNVQDTLEDAKVDFVDKVKRIK